MSIFKTVLKAPIRFYSFIISPLIGPSCRFSQSCSSYALEAINKHGALRGLYLSVKRILRCHPWHRCSHYDPVPETFDWRG